MAVYNVIMHDQTHNTLFKAVNITITYFYAVYCLSDDRNITHIYGGNVCRGSW